MDAEFFRAWIAEIAAVVEAQRDHLTQLDSAIGDADHGINLARGFGAVQTALTARFGTAVAILAGAALYAACHAPIGAGACTSMRPASTSRPSKALITDLLIENPSSGVSTLTPGA